MAVTLHTDLGEIKLELFCEETPKACENFLALCARDPTDTGKGGESIWGKPFEDELRDNLKHQTRGVVAMANTGPDSNRSQFYITYSKQPSLDLKSTVFGRVINGFDVLDVFEALPVDEETYRPKREVRIRRVTIHANPIAN